MKYKGKSLLTSLLLVGYAVALTGCANMIYPEKQPLGNASKTNAAVHIVNPDAPAYDTPPEMSGKRSRGAIDRYHRGTTLTPENVDTSGDE